MSQPPGNFAASINDFESWPENLAHQTTCLSVLKAHKTRLDVVEPKLFTQEAEDIKVTFLDLIESGPTFDKLEVSDDEELQQRLGEASRTFCNGTVRGEDPKSRFIFICAESPQAPLKISRKMLVRVLSYHQVIPGYVDHLLEFDGHRKDMYSGFLSQALLNRTPSMEVDYLGRSGRQLQLCYNLRSIGRTKRNHLAPCHKQWSFRQAAFHHQFDILKGTAVWVITTADLNLKRRIEESTGKTGMGEDRQFQTPDQCLKSSLTVHLLLCDWVHENWRPYFLWLDGTVEDEMYLRVHNRRIHEEYPQIYSSGDLEAVRNLQEQTERTLQVLKGNIGVFSGLRDFYHGLGENDRFPLRESCIGDISSFTHQIDNLIDETKRYFGQGQLIAKIIAARETIIFQHFQSQGIEKMEQLTTSMQRHSLTVRIIAFLMSIYLPATFASTIYSSDVFKYQNQDPISTNDAPGPTKQLVSFPAIALDRWLQVTLPMTCLIFAAAGLWLWREDRKLRRVYKNCPTALTRLAD